MNEQWLIWARKLQAISQTGLHYAKDQYDIERYEEIQTIAAEMMSVGCGGDIQPILKVFSEQYGYATPKVDVRGVVFRNDRILLVQERIDGGWTIPGGWADVCEPPRSCVEREVFEEAGFRVDAKKLCAVYDRDMQGHEPPYPFHIYKLFFLCEITGGEATTSYETLAVDFFDLDKIPPLSLSRTTHKEIERMYAHYKNPNLPVEFD